MSTENEQVVLTERRGHILVVTLNRPEVHNACNLALARGISDAMDLLDAEDGLFVGVITGTYSSVYIASPVVIWIEDVMKARRERQAGGDSSSSGKQRSTASAKA